MDIENEENTMPTWLERRRLKDRILESTSRAVKYIQKFQLCSVAEVPVLTNTDWQFHKLVEHLDHAFLHGLRHITNGYWVVVQDFTHKSTVREVSHLQNVTTNLGRGRAWLYSALNEHLLESYMQCFINNGTLVKKYYAKEALVLDHQRMQILLTLSSGLELVTFQLDLDQPYLDLASHTKPAQRKEEEEDEGQEDQVSLCSMNSSLSQGSSETLDPGSVTEDLLSSSLKTRSNSVSNGWPHEDELVTKSRPPFKSSNSLPIMESADAVDCSRSTRLSRLASMDEKAMADDGTLESSSNDLEVIHIRTKGQRMKKRRNTKRKSDGDAEGLSLNSFSGQEVDTISTNSVSSLTTPLTPESGYRSVMENPSPRMRDFPKDEVGNQDNYLANTIGSSEPMSDSGEMSLPDGASEPDIEPSFVSSSANDRTRVQIQVVNSTLNWTTDVLQETEDQPVISNDCHDSERHNILNMAAEKPAEDCVYQGDRPKATSVEANPVNSVVVEKCDAGGKCSCSSEELSIYDSNGGTMNDRKSSCSQAVNPDRRQILALEDVTDNISGVQIVEKGNLTLVESPKCQASETDACCATASHSASDSAVNLEARTEVVSQEHAASVAATSSGGATPVGPIASSESHTAASVETRKPELVHDAEIRVDNNLMLLLMLEVFQEEEEHFIRMVQTCLGHTEGDLQPVFVMITDLAIYILSSCYGERKFHKEAVVQYKELDYISLSLNYQVINIVCTNRRKQVWVTTGDELLTKCIVGHINKAIRHSNEDLPRLSVLTDATTQKIAMKKWLSQEYNVQMTDVTLLCYALVHWVDLQTVSPVSGVHITASREGILLYKSHDSLFGFGASVWKHGYFVLKDGCLYQYLDKHDNTPPRLCIQLNHEDCGGCRRKRQADQEHCFEIVTSNGSLLQLSAASDVEAQEWLQSLCQVVAGGMGMRSSSGGCLACCCVLTSSKIILCHEDVQTNFFRTLGAGNIVDVSSILYDPGAQTFIVLVFEPLGPDGPRATEKWIVYFNTAAEKDKFVNILSQTWKAHFQISLPVCRMEDMALQKQCREGIGKLKQMRRA